MSNEMALLAKPNICFQWKRRNLLAAVFTTFEGICRLYYIPVKFLLVFSLFFFFFVCLLFCFMNFMRLSMPTVFALSLLLLLLLAAFSTDATAVVSFENCQKVCVRVE